MAEINKGKPRHRNELGDIGERVRRNLRTLRDDRGMSTAELSRLLTELGRPMQPTAITKIEAGDRRVDVDDVAALAVALGTTTTWLMLATDKADDELRLAPNATSTEAASAWQWAVGVAPLWEMYPPEGLADETYDAYRRHAAPGWLASIENHTAIRAVRDVADDIVALLRPRHPDPRDVSNVVRRVFRPGGRLMRSLHRLVAEVEQLTAQDYAPGFLKLMANVQAKNAERLQTAADEAGMSVEEFVSKVGLAGVFVTAGVEITPEEIERALGDER